MSLWRYRDRLPVEPLVTLHEGDTPLIPAPHLSERTGAEVWLKFEGANPTGSFKDRGMTVAVSAAVREGAQAVICASTGNTAASAAAYAARAGLRGAVIVPEGNIATGKLAQALMHDARVVALRGNFDEALVLVRELVERHPISLVNSINEYRIAGQKTAAFEVCDALGEPPDVLAIPVGNAGNITSWHRGFEEYEDAIPRLLGFQAEGQPRSCTVARWRGRRPSRRRSGSATPPAGRRPWRRSPPRADRSARSPIRRYWPPTGSWRPRRASSASRRQPPRSRGCSSTAPRVGWCAC